MPSATTGYTNTGGFMMNLSANRNDKAKELYRRIRKHSDGSKFVIKVYQAADEEPEPPTRVLFRVVNQTLIGLEDWTPNLPTAEEEELDEMPLWEVSLEVHNHHANPIGLVKLSSAPALSTAEKEQVSE